MADESGEKPDMDDVEDVAPSGDLKDDQDGESGKSSKLDKLLQRLHGQGSADHSRESSPDPSVKDAGQGGRQSRRKPKVTRKVVDEDERSMDVGSSAAERSDVDMVDAAMDMAIQEFLNSADKDPEEDISNDNKKDEEEKMDKNDESTDDKQKEESIDVDEEGNLILPEGTVVVEPEAVTDNKPVFKGPEFRSSRSTSGVKSGVHGEADLSVVHCSSCNHQINTNTANSVKRHPVLKVVLCKRCYNWYTSDEIVQDEDGMDEQCRWCGEGGDLLCCDYCHNAFCKGCIRRNLGRGELSHLLNAGEDSKWHCYVCDPKPLAELIYNCNQIIEAVEKREQKNKEREKKNKEREEALARKKQDEKKKKTQVQVQPRQQPAQQQRYGGKAQVIQQKGSIINLTKQPQSIVIQSGTQKIQSIKPGTQRQIIGQVSAGNVPAEWNFRLNENNVMPIIDRAMMVTESMHMLLSSLREDIQKAGTSSSKTATKQDCAGKLKRAFNAFNKSFIDLSLFSQKTSSPATVKKLLDEQQRANKQGLVHGRVQPQGRIQPQGNIQQRGRIQVTQQQPVLPVRLIQHGEKIRVTPSGNTVMQQKGKQMPVTKQQPIMPKPNGKVEIIELLDSDDESSKSKTPPKKQSDEKKEDSDSDKSEDEKSKKKGFQLKVALGGPGHKLKGPLSKRKQFEEKERAKEEKAAKEQKEKEDKEKENKDLDKEKEDKESGNEDQDEDNNQDSNDNTNISTKEHEDVEKMADDDDDNHDKTEEPVAETNQEESKEEAMDVDLDAGDAEEPEQKETEEKDTQDENKPSDVPVEDDQNTNEENGDLEDFKTIEEQLKQLNGDFSGVGMDQFSQSGSKNDSQSATPDKSRGDAKVVQLDGALDNHESSSNADSPGSTSDVKKSYDELYNSVQFDPLFNLDDLSNSASTASEVDNEVMFDLGDGDYDNELGQDSEKQFDFGANDNTEDSDLENNEQESIENMDDSGESNLDIQPDEDMEPERPVKVTETVQQSPVKRSRADIEAQRLLHKELLDDSGENSNENSDDTDDDDDDDDNKDDDEELNKKEKVSKKSSQKNKQMSDEEYNPKKDAGQLKEDRKLGSSRLRSRNARGKGGKRDLRVIKKRTEESDSESDNEKEGKKNKKSRKHSKGQQSQKHAENGRDTESKSKKHSKDSEKSSDDAQSKEELNSDSDFESNKRKKDHKKSKDSVEKGKDSKKSKDKKTLVSGSELSDDGNESEKSNEDELKKKKLQKCKELKKDRKISKDKKSDVDNSDLGEDSERQDKKDKKHSKKLEKTTARESDSSNFDSDLERDIDELAKMPQLKEKRKAKKSAARKDESDNEIKDKASKEKTKTVKVGRQTRQSRKDLIEDMSSDEAVDQPEEEEEPESDKASISSGSDMETKRHQAAAEDDDMDSKARKALLAEDSSGEDSEDSDIAMIRDQKDLQKTSSSKKPASKASSQADEEEDYDSDDITPAKNRVHNALLDAKLSDSDSAFENFIKKRKKADISSDDTSDDSTNKKKSKKSKKDSSDSSSDSDSNKKKKKGQKGKGRKKKKSSSSSSNSDSDSDEDGKSKKKKKRRRVKMETDSDEGSDDSANGTPGKRRKHIRKILKDKKLSESTLSAAKAEEERRKRVIERQKLYNEKTEEDKNSPTKCIVTTQLVLEASEEDKPVVQVSKTLIRKLKPHQVDAVKFLWDCCAETCKRLKKEDGSGCILAHCMGLGKTLSVITFISTLMSAQKKTKIKTCLVVCPLNTVLNWQSEFEKWLEEEDAIDVWEMSGIKDNPSRGDALKDWHESGGIMIMGYEMYRNLATNKNIRKKKLKNIMTECLVDPGPDVVVCDEGHLLKNDASSISKAMNNIRTRRRVVLTGTPLQNNLVEYHCMVDFVKPNLLGSRKEFTNRFVHPMSNGQCSDSTAHDVKIMKRRAHILHETLAGCVQRRDYSALTKFLLPKLEYVVSIRLTPIQIELYQKFLDRNLQSLTVNGRITNRGARLFTDYIALSRIWTHPWALRLDEIRQQNKRDRMFDDDSEDSFINDDDSDESDAKSTGGSSSSESGADKPKAKNKHMRSTRNNPNLEGQDENGKGKDSPGGADSDVGECVSRDWWGDYLAPEDQYKAEIGSKIVILAEVLKMCEAIGDKVLVFSQSLVSLNLIEDFLEYWDQCSKSSDPENQIAGTGTWVAGLDYHRLDGRTSATKRRDTTANFNDPDNPRMRLFLISTRAGSLGINLVSANRVIVFDASWNPTHDVQSIFRVYRFGQTKPVYVYRFLAQGTMEEKIYERQVTKQSLAQRVIDEHQIERHFSANDLQELYNFKPDRLDDPDREEKPTPKLPKDRLLAELLSTMKDHIVTYHEHDSLLENITEECLTEEERKAAWEEFEAEKKGLIKRGPSIGSNTMMQYNMMLAQQQQAQYMSMNQPANDLQMIVPEAEQIARAIYAANPGISQDILQQKVHMYLQQRMEQQKAMIAQRQREQQMQQEVMKLQKLRLERYRQQEYVQSMMQNSQPHTQFSSLMQQLAGQSTAASTGDGSAVSSRSTTPLQQNGAASTGLLDMLKKDTQNK